MTSAKVTFKQQDRSTIVSSMEGIYAGLVINSIKGPVLTPTLVTSETDLINRFGIPDPKLGTSMYSAMTYLKQGNKLWVSRSSSSTAKKAAVLVRSKITDIPTDPLDEFDDQSLIVKPLMNGLTQEEFDAYQFDTYLGNRIYSKTDFTVFENVTNSDTVRIGLYDNSLKPGDSVSFSSNTESELNDPTDNVGEDTLLHHIKEIKTEVLSYDNAIVDSAVTAEKGTEIQYLDPDDGVTVLSYANNPKLVRDATATTNLLVDNADYIAPGDTLVIDGAQVVFNEKVHYQEDAVFFVFDAMIESVTTDLTIFELTQSEFEDRDAFLVYAHEGKWANDITIGIANSTNYNEAFIILVYYKGVLVESWEVTRYPLLDGYQFQMEMEQKINGKSAYISVLNNDNNVTEDDEGNEVFPKPLITDYSLWRQDSEDLFLDSGNELNENLLKGHIEVKLSSIDNLELGTRIKFFYGKLSAEYKVASIDANNISVMLDRQLVEDEIGRTYVDGSGTTQSTKVMWFNDEYNDDTKGILNGVQYYSIDRISNVYYNYPLNSPFTISGIEGTLVSAGANMMRGGSLGDTVTLGESIKALKLFSNPAATPINCLMDGGLYEPAFAAAMIGVKNSQIKCHCYFSSNPANEQAVDYLSALAAQRSELAIDDSEASLFCGWRKVFDEYNQVYVWTSPEAYAVAAQSFTTRNYNMFTPAAGMLRGQMGGLQLLQEFSSEDCDYLTDNNINPSINSGASIVIWGNITLYTKPSPLQLRSVAMLLIVVKTGLDGLLLYELFDFNDEDTWTSTEGAIDAFMRDQIKAKGGVYDYEVSISGVITDGDIDNRNMPVFIGLQPTMDILTIPVTLAIYNKSAEIEVSL